VREIGIDAVFMPDNKLMYAGGFSTYIQVDTISDRLCGSFRPGHFRGVATVVAKLLNIASPTRAYFGQKDFQQTVIIKKMAKDLNFRSEIVVCPTVREEDGLAMSSRNRYLNPAERSSAAAIFRAMTKASEMLQSGSGSVPAARDLLQGELKKEELITGIDYASVFNAETLEEAGDLTNMREVVIAAAVRMGKTRLIDNLLVHL
jgi:pantoate--beta-alanine ligase